MRQMLKRLTVGVLLTAAVLVCTAFGASRETVITVGVIAGS